VVIQIYQVQEVLVLVQMPVLLEQVVQTDSIMEQRPEAEVVDQPM
jgi:hypothetical protein